MATATFIRNGEVAEYKNSGTSAITNGKVVSLTTRIGVAADDIAAGGTGMVNLCGVYRIPKAATLAISQGDAVYYNATNDNIDKTASGGIPAGFAIAAATADDTTVLVKIG